MQWLAPLRSIPSASAPIELDAPAVANAFAGPLLFEQNVGQAPAGAQFVASGGGLKLYASPERIAISAPIGEKPAIAPERPGIDRPEPDPRPHALFSMEFLGANPRAVGHSMSLRGSASYSTLPDSIGITEREAARYERVRFAEAYPGIDLELYGVERGMEYDFVVQPGADPAAIRLGFRNVEKASLNDAGEILMQTVAGEIRQSAPTVYQDEGGKRTLIDARFEEAEPGVFLLALADYDQAQPLVIDPTIHFSGAVGGPGGDQIRDITSDPEGNLYITGFTTEASWLMATASLDELLEEGPVPQQTSMGYGFIAKLVKVAIGSYQITKSRIFVDILYLAISLNRDTLCAAGNAGPLAPAALQRSGPGGLTDARLTCMNTNLDRLRSFNVGGAGEDYAAPAFGARGAGKTVVMAELNSRLADVPVCRAPNMQQVASASCFFAMTPTAQGDMLDVELGGYQLYEGSNVGGGVSWVQPFPDDKGFVVGGASNARQIAAGNSTITGGSAAQLFRPFNIRCYDNSTVVGSFANLGGNSGVFNSSGAVIGDFLLQSFLTFVNETQSTARVYVSRLNTTQFSSNFAFGSPSGFNYAPRIKSIGFGLFYFGGSSNSVAGFQPTLSNAPSSISGQNMVVGLSQIDAETGAVDNLWTYMAGNSTTTSDQVLLGLTCDDWHNPVACGCTSGGGFPAVNGQSAFQGGEGDGIITQFYNPFVAPNAVVMNGQFQNPGVLAPCGAVAAFGHLMPGSNTIGAPVDNAFPTQLNGYEATLFPGAVDKGQGAPVELFGVFENGQVNGMLPCDFPLGEAYLQITEGADTAEPLFSNPVLLTIQAAAPQWAVFYDGAEQKAACLNASKGNTLVTMDNPTDPGDILQCYFFGGGQSMPACESIAPLDQLLTLIATLTVTLGGLAMNPTAFIAPGLTCALGQTNFAVSADIQVDDLVPPEPGEAGIWVQVGDVLKCIRLAIGV